MKIGLFKKRITLGYNDYTSNNAPIPIFFLPLFSPVIFFFMIGDFKHRRYYCQRCSVLRNSYIGTVIRSLPKMSWFNVLINDVEKWVCIPRIIWQKKRDTNIAIMDVNFSSVRYWPNFYCMGIILRIVKIIRPWFKLRTYIV